MLVVTKNDEKHKRSLAAWEECHATVLRNIKKTLEVRKTWN